MMYDPYNVFLDSAIILLRIFAFTFTSDIFFIVAVLFGFGIRVIVAL